jgi:hypothetical protein
MYDWTVGGRTLHVEVRQYFLRDPKEENFHNRYISGFLAIRILVIICSRRIIICSESIWLLNVENDS